MWLALECGLRHNAEVEWAWCVKQLLDENYPQVECLCWSVKSEYAYRRGIVSKPFPPRKRGDCGSGWRFTAAQARQLVQYGGDRTEVFLVNALTAG